MRHFQRHSVFGLKTVYTTVSLVALGLGLSGTGFAQTTIPDGQTITVPVNTTDPIDGDNDGATPETSGDLTIDSGGTIATTAAGAAVTINSDNSVTNNGAISIEDVNDTTGVEIDSSMATAGGYSGSGTINVTETYTRTNTDNDQFGIVDGPVAEGSGRTGILISGGSTFTGDVENAGTVTVEGNDSNGILLASGTTLDGDLRNTGSVSFVGENGAGLNIAGTVTGDVRTANIGSVGAASNAVLVTGDVQGGFANVGNINNTGYSNIANPTVFVQNLLGLVQRSSLNVRETLDAEDLAQSGPAVQIEGNVDGGLAFRAGSEAIVDENGDPVLDANGDPTFRTLASSVVHNGGTPAILVDGAGHATGGIIIGPFTNPDDPTGPQYAFLNQGLMTANGVYNDFNASVLQVDNATLNGGISNSGIMTSYAYVGPVENPDQTVLGNVGEARTVVIGADAIIGTFNNSGTIGAVTAEDIEAVYSGDGTITAPRQVLATAIDIMGDTGNGDTITMENSGQIASVLFGRDGTAYAIRDRSGRLVSLSNQGSIRAEGNTSDPNEQEATSFTLIALDASNNTTGFTLTQSQSEEENSLTPSISGDILLGTGDDMVDISAGTVVGDLAFNAGNDSLSLSGGSGFLGAISSTGGLDISVAGSTLALNNTESLSVTNASFDETSTFAPLIGASNGPVLDASGDISFAAGAAIIPVIQSIFGLNEQAVIELATAGNSLTVGDLSSLSAGDTPFLYNSQFDVQNNTLVITLTRRDPNLGVAAGGLGLDPVQAAAFSSNIEAWGSNSDLGGAIANITDATAFNQAYNQTLPEFAAAGRQFLLANVDGAVGAVGSHLDATRRSPEKPGGAWIQEFAYFADRDLAGLSEQYRGSGFGFAGGFDSAFGPFHAVGLNFGFGSTEIEDVVGVDDPLDILTLQAGLYAGWASGDLSVDVYAGGGYSDFEQERVVSIGSFLGDARGDWTGTHFNGSVKVGYDLALSDRFWARPSVVVDYLRLSESAYRETGTTGITLGVDSRTSDTGAVTGLLNFGGNFQGRRTWFRPSIRAGIRHEFLSDPVLTNYRYINLVDANGAFYDSATTASLLSSEFPATGIIVGFSLAAGSAYSSIGFDLDSDIRDGFIRHTGRVVVRLLF